MSAYYRERRDAGVYDADEAAREKAGAKFDKQWNARQEQVQEEAVTTEEGTANPK